MDAARGFLGSLIRGVHCPPGALPRCIAHSLRNNGLRGGVLRKFDRQLNALLAQLGLDQQAHRGLSVLGRVIVPIRPGVS